MLTAGNSPSPAAWGVLLATLPQQDLSFYADSLSLQAEASIIDTCAQVTITQTFALSSNAKIALRDSAQTSANQTGVVEAAYQFPLPENAAVCKFECECDGQIIKGIVKEKNEARKVYDKALSDGKKASLLEQQQPDVFQISVGNITSDAPVITRITYIQELQQNGDQDEIRFYLLSKKIQPKYGIPPPVSVSSAAYATTVFQTEHGGNSLKPPVKIDIQMTGPIQSIQSPSHSSVTMTLGCSSASPSANSQFDPCKAHVMLDQDTGAYLDRELVIVVKSKGLDQPRCVVERHPVDGTHAIGLTLVPRFVLNEIRTEIIILVDRSGSMSGDKITQASKALKLLLASFPANKGLYFNIISFGSDHSFLFPNQSLEYTAQTLATAQHHVTDLKADMGGTELLRAVEACLKSRRRDMPTQLFVLTDGDIWNSESLFTLVRDEIAKSKDSSSTSSFFRAFTLGIGNDVSHNLVEGLARAGDGFAQFVTTSERLQPKIIKMLKSAVLPPINDYKIHWTDSNWTGPPLEVEDPDWETVQVPAVEKKSIALFAEEPVAPPPPPPPPQVKPVKRYIQPAPFHVPTLWPGSRFTVYAILDSTVPVPSSIRITATSPDGPLELNVPVKLSETSSDNSIHCLAARKLIRDLEEHTSFLDTDGVRCPEEVCKVEMVNLGVKYSLVSKHTSFVAVAADQGVIPEEFKQPPPLRNLAKSVTVDDEESDDDMGFGLFDGGSPVSYFKSAIVSRGAAKQVFIDEECEEDDDDSGDDWDPLTTTTTQPATAGASFATMVPQEVQIDPALVAQYECELLSAGSMPLPADDSDDDLGGWANYGGPIHRAGFSMPLQTPAQPAPVPVAAASSGSVSIKTDDDILQHLVNLQAFDGSFSLGDVNKLVNAINPSLVDLAAVLAKEAEHAKLTGDMNVLAKAFAVVVVLKLLETRLKALEEEWEMMAGKAKGFAVGAVGVDVFGWLTGSVLLSA